MAEKKITQDGLAKAIGISGYTLNMKLNGKRKFTVEEAILIVKILEIEDPRPFFFN